MCDKMIGDGTRLPVGSLVISVEPGPQGSGSGRFSQAIPASVFPLLVYCCLDDPSPLVHHNVDLYQARTLALVNGDRQTKMVSALK